MTEFSARLKESLSSRYRIERELGRGGMAIVFLAHDIKHRRPVALKVLRPELAAAVGAERFLREIEVASRLVHPNILPLHDSDEVDGLLYYVMPFVEGESLRDYITRERQLPVDYTIAVIQEVCDALAYAHAVGVVHRDIKPDNILLAAGHAVVSDFGIARAIDASGTEQITATGMALGTPAYMSPEQGNGDGAIDARCDVYSLGCSAFEMLTGRPPFSGPPMAVLARHATERVPPLRAVRPDVPDFLDVILARMLAKSPADRLSAADLSVALRRPSHALPRSRSIAVLPFINLGGDPANAYFADGMTEDVIAQLSKIRSLRVISRASVMPFRNRDVALHEIGRQLGVATLLDGSIRSAAGKVRIVAQLVDAASGEQLWADTYDRELTDLFAIQSDVALRIASALEAELSPEERVQLKDHGSARHGPSPEAYEAFLRGRFHWNQHTPEGLETALRHFEHALEIHPDFALAHGCIADVAGARAFVGVVPPREVHAMARDRVLKALSLDDRLPQLHDYLGRLHCWFDWDWVRAEMSYRRAMDLNVNYADVRVFYAWMLAARGRWQESATQIGRALELDPLNPFVHWVSGFIRFLNAKYEDAVIACTQTLRMDPGMPLPRLGLWGAHHLSGRYDAALVEARNYFSALGDREIAETLGDGGAENYIEVMRSAAGILAARSSERYTPATQVARFYAFAGQGDTALAWLERGCEERDFPMVYMRVDPTWSLLRDDIRFSRLLNRVESLAPPG